MNADAFLERLDGHRQAGRLDDESFDRIAAHEAKESPPQPVVIALENEASTLDEVVGPRYKENSIRFGLGIVAAIATTLVLLGFGLFASLIDDSTGVDLILPMFAAIAAGAYFAPLNDLKGRAGVFVGEARSLLFGFGLLVATTWYVVEILDLSYNEVAGPVDILTWGPMLAVAAASAWFARRMDAWITYCFGWIFWLWALFSAVEQPSDYDGFVSLLVVMGVLTVELVREWQDESLGGSSVVQANFIAMVWGIAAWVSIDLFEGAFQNDLIWCFVLVAAWFLAVEALFRTQSARRYVNNQHKGWIPMLGVLVFYTGLPIYTGFELARNVGPRELGIADFDLHLGWVYGLAIHALMGLQMYRWDTADVVLRPSLTEPRMFTGGVFFVMASVWFIFGAFDFLEDLAAYLFLPLGLMMLFFGTRRLIRTTAAAQQE